MATSKTADQLIDRVASILGKKVPGEALSSVDKAVINEHVDPVLEEVAKIIFVNDRNAIPDRYFLTLARLVAVHAASDFSNTDLDEVAAMRHENRLRYLAASPYTGDTVRFVNF